MSKLKMRIWGREFELGVYFNVFEGEEISDAQKKALDLFLKANVSNIVDSEKKDETQNKNADEPSEFPPIENSKTAVEEYCIDNSNEEEIDKPITNIFKYVIPKYIFVDNLSEEDTRIVALMCNFKFDMEHGLAVIFKNEKFDEIGEQGLVL